MSEDVERFVVAQSGIYDGVMAELAAGLKEGHWMWFVFPQVSGLGSSPTAKRYAITSIEEAKAYLGHPVLGPRLRQCVRLLLGADDRSAESILGPVDALKLHSSATLFGDVAPYDPMFQQLLDRFYDGRKDAATERILVRWRSPS